MKFFVQLSFNFQLVLRVFQVREWRENKMELMKLEQEMANKRRREMEAVVAAEEERLRVKRQEQKEKV